MPLWFSSAVWRASARKRLRKPGIAGVLLLEDLDGDDAAQDLVLRLPDFTHAADGDTFSELVPAA